MGIEKRQHRRHDLQLPVQFEWEGETHDVRSVNVSAGGMLIEMDDPPPTDELLDFRIHLGRDGDPEERELRVRGCVVRLGGPGFGIRFDRVDEYEEELAYLEAFLALYDQ